MKKGFTLVIPLYNKVKYVKTTLDSVLNNHGTYPFKCIIVDDDSTDGSSEIAEEYDEKYPDVFEYYKVKHHGNKTPIYARNLAIKLADTEYIGFLDADDELCTGFIDRGCGYLDEHPECSMYGCGMKKREVVDGETCVYWYGYVDNEKITNFPEYVLYGGCDISFCAHIYRTELVKKNLFTDCFCEDVVFKLKYIHDNPSIYIDYDYYNSFIYNTIYSESSELFESIKDVNQNKNKVHQLEYVFNILNKDIPDFKYKILPEEDGIHFILQIFD